MREIKFRGREVIGNQRKLGGWVFGDLVHYCGGYERTVDDEITPVVTEICIECADCLINVDPSTVGQFTGMKDSSGREIYEGDILFVKAENPYWSKFDSKHVVTWCNDGWILNDYGTDDPGLFHILMNNNCEIIGNVHDNPELLEVEA